MTDKVVWIPLYLEPSGGIRIEKEKDGSILITAEDGRLILQLYNSEEVRTLINVLNSLI